MAGNSLFTALADIFAGFFIGTLSGMGVGGGGLLVVYLTVLRGFSQRGAQGCNLVFFVFASVASMFIHKERRKLNMKLIGLCATLTTIGSFIGVSIGFSVSDALVRRVFGIFLITTGIISTAGLVMRRKSSEN